MKEFRKVFEQTSWQVLGKVISSLSTIVVLGIVTRSYGEDGTGIFTLALTYLAFFYLAVDIGFNAYILPRLNEFPTEPNKLFNFRIYWSLFLILAANIIALFMPFKDPLFIQSVFLGSVTITFYGVFNSANLIFQSNLDYKRSIIASSIGVLLNIPLTFMLAYNRSPISLVVFVTAVGWLVNNIVALFLVYKYYKFSLQLPDTKFIFNLIKHSWPISLTMILNVVYFRVDTFILSAYYSFPVVGNYNLAFQIFQSILVLPTFIMNGFYPLMVESLKNDKKLFEKQIKQASLVLLVLATLITFFFWTGSPLIINIISGGGFNEAVVSLKILVLSLPAFFVSSLFMWTLITLGKYKQMCLIYFGGLVLNLSANTIFIPQFSLIAASWVTVISEYVILLMLFLYLAKLMNEKRKEVLE